MLEDGVTERIKTLLRSDMPPVQFKLLGTLRMMVDGQGEQTWSFKEFKYSCMKHSAHNNSLRYDLCEISPTIKSNLDLLKFN